METTITIENADISLLPELLVKIKPKKMVIENNTLHNINVNFKITEDKFIIIIE